MLPDRRVSLLDLYKLWPLLRGLEGDRVERVYSAGELFAVATRECVLLLSPRRGPALVRGGVELPPGAARCRWLGELEGRRVDAVEQVNGDRVLLLRAGRASLVLEWVREGNVLLLDGEGRVAHALRQREMRDRVVARGRPYTPPPRPGDAFSDALAQLYERFRASGRRAAATSMSLAASLPAEVVYEAFYRRGVDPGLRASDVDERLFAALLAEAREVFLEGLADPQGGYEAPGTPGALYPFRAEHLGATERVEGYAERLSSLIARLALGDAGGPPPEDVASRLAEAARAAEEAARLLVDNAWRVDQVLEAYRRLREERLPWGELAERLRSEFPEVLSVDPAKGVVVVQLGGTSVEVQAGLSAMANAERYFERAKAVRARLEGLQRSKPAEQAVVVVAPRPRTGQPWYAQFRHFRTSGGFLVVAGRTAGQNELLVRRYMEPGDIFLHADIHGAPATVLKTGGRQPGEADILEAAQFAACYSSAWRAGLYVVDVFWVPGGQVSKRPPSGEYLGVGSFMVYGKRNYVRGVRLELLVGYAEGEGLVALPALASPREGCFLKLTPGRLSRDLAARKIVEFLRRECGVRGVREQDVLRLLPEGGFYLERWRPP